MKTQTILAVATTLVASFSVTATAQMTTGSGMEDFARTFGISARGWTVQQTGCSQGANAL